MYQGNLRVGRSGDTVVAGVVANTPRGPILVRGKSNLDEARSVAYRLAKANPRRFKGGGLSNLDIEHAAHKLAVRSAARQTEEVMGFMPIQDVVAQEAISEAQTLFKMLVNGDAKAKALARARIGFIRQKAAAGDSKSMDADFVIRRVAGAAYKQLYPEEVMGGFFDFVGDIGSAIGDVASSVGDVFGDFGEGAVNLVSQFAPVAAPLIANVIAPGTGATFGPVLAQGMQLISGAVTGQKAANNTVNATKVMAQAGVPAAQNQALILKGAQTAVNTMATAAAQGKNPIQAVVLDAQQNPNAYFPNGVNAPVTPKTSPSMFPKLIETGKGAFARELLQGRNLDDISWYNAGMFLPAGLQRF